MKYRKTIKLPNAKLHLITNSAFILDIILEQLSFSKFRAGYKTPISIIIKLEEVNSFPYGRSDGFKTNKDGLFLESWLENIQVDAYPKKNLIVGKILTPITLSSEAIFDLLVFHPLRHILKYKNIFFIHAAALEKNNKGVLVCGPFKSGKSTLALKLMEEGLKFLSDEFIVFNKEHLVSFPLKIGLERSSLQIFPKLERLAKKNKNCHGKLFFDIRNFYPDCCTQTCIPHIIIFPVQQKRSQSVVVKEIDKKSSFSLLCMDKDNSLPYEKDLAIRQRQIGVLSNLVKKAKSYFLLYSLDKTHEAAKIVNNLLG